MEKDIIKIKPCKKIETFDAEKKKNSWLLELISDRDGFTKHIQGQAYLTVAAPGYFKGFHLHALADYFVTCIKGRIQHIIYTSKDSKHEIEMGDGDFKTVFLPKGFPHGIKNIGEGDAHILIYRYPSWDPDVNEQLDIKPEEIEREGIWEQMGEFIEGFRSNAKNK